ncbi:MAG: hypothetical protein Q9224_005969, partial [Gallowayella concinna]
SLMMLLKKWDQGLLPDLPRRLLQDRILLVLFGIVVETLQRQEDDGSWGLRSRETTAYAVITLSTAAPLSLFDELKTQMELSVYKGKAFLLQQLEAWGEPDNVWAGKTVYGIGVLTEAYTIAAMNTTAQTYGLSKVTDDLCSIARQSLKKIQKITVLPFFANMPDWLRRACVVEGYLHLSSLNSLRQELSTHDIKQQSQFNIIPLAVIAAGRVNGASLTPEVSLQFMGVCVLIYYVDHYFEDVIGKLVGAKLEEVEQSVRQLFEMPTDECHSVDHRFEQNGPEQELAVGASDHIPDIVKDALRRCTRWALDHPGVLSASGHDQSLMRREFAGYYLSQITDILDRSTVTALRGSYQDLPSPTKMMPQQTYHKWLHTTGADRIGGLCSFAFLICLLSPSDSGQDCFHGAEAKYIAQDLSLHAALTARIENDIGSITRDRLENNLNSADFPEFDTRACDTQEQDDDLRRRLEILRRLAGYERECYQRALEKLSGLGIHDRVLKGLRAFCNLVDIYGQIYAMEDPGIRVERGL